MAIALGKTPSLIGDMNVTPLIDVLLVLLIIFMVITPRETVGLEAALPQPSRNGPNSPEPNRAIVVRIDRNLAITINSEPTNMERLGSRLAEILKLRADRVVFVKADGNLEFRDVARVIDIATGAGINTIGLLGAA